MTTSNCEKRRLDTSLSLPKTTLRELSIREAKRVPKSYSGLCSLVVVQTHTLAANQTLVSDVLAGRKMIACCEKKSTCGTSHISFKKSSKLNQKLLCIFRKRSVHHTLDLSSESTSCHFSPPCAADERQQTWHGICRDCVGRVWTARN